MNRRLVPLAALALTLAACSSGSKSSSSQSSSAPSTTAAPATGLTIGSANLPGVGTVLVNDKGMTLYVLSSEKGGKVTCEDDNGCTKAWPDNELPKGVANPTAGPGVQDSLLGTATNAKGDHYASYATYPLYTFSGDSGPGQTHGQGIKSFGGTWWVMSTAGTPVKT